MQYTNVLGSQQGAAAGYRLPTSAPIVPAAGAGSQGILYVTPSIGAISSIVDPVG
jgi:hypothetical protein